MKKIWYTVLPLVAAVVILTGCSSSPTAAESSARSSGTTSGTTRSAAPSASGVAALQSRYMAYLQEEGYSPSIDDDGDVWFRVQGKNYYIIIDARDAEHFMILYPNFWLADTTRKRQQATLAASYATAKTKVARAYLGTNNYVSATSEVFLNDSEDYRYVFPRMLRSITTAVGYFEEYLDEE